MYHHLVEVPELLVWEPRAHLWHKVSERVRENKDEREGFIQI